MKLLTILAVMLTLLEQPGRRVDQTPSAGPGTAEMQRLMFYLGDWDYTEEYPKSASSPNGLKNTGLYTSKLGPGGNSLINTFHSQGPAGDFQGLLILTWDMKEKAYKAYVFGNESPGAIVQTGAFDGDALVFRAQFAAGPQTLKMRNVTRVRSAEILESDAYSSVNDGPEKLLVHVTAVRKH